MSATTESTTHTVTLTCTGTNGAQIATLTLDTSTTFATTALRAVIGDRTSGTAPAERFARSTFNALRDYESKTDLRSRVILKHLSALDHLALTAVGRGIPATITWA
jgi:hypothetical protein